MKKSPKPQGSMKTKPMEKNYLDPSWMSPTEREERSWECEKIADDFSERMLKNLRNPDNHPHLTDEERAKSEEAFKRLYPD